MNTTEMDLAVKSFPMVRQIVAVLVQSARGPRPVDAQRDVYVQPRARAPTARCAPGGPEDQEWTALPRIPIDSLRIGAAVCLPVIVPAGPAEHEVGFGRQCVAFGDNPSLITRVPDHAEVAHIESRRRGRVGVEELLDKVRIPLLRHRVAKKQHAVGARRLRFLDLRPEESQRIHAGLVRRTLPEQVGIGDSL